MRDSESGGVFQQDRTTRTPPPQLGPSRLEWAVAVFAAVVQQNAFLSIPLYFGNPSLHFRQDQNVLNTIAVAASLVSIVPFCISQRESIYLLARKNVSSILFLLLVLASASWSIHPDLSLRRGVGYVLTLLVAAYLTVRFDVNDRMKVFSYSFAIAALGSLLFVATFPADGIMNVAELTGDWRGIFPHKNVLGRRWRSLFSSNFLFYSVTPGPERGTRFSESFFSWL